MKTLYKLDWNFRRMGSVRGVFISTPDELNSIVGKEIFFGEILGKHSEIQGVFDLEYVTVLTDDQSFIEQAEKIKLVPFGYNPCQHVIKSCGCMENDDYCECEVE